MGKPKTNKYSLMSDKEIIDYLNSRYQKHGVSSLSYHSIKQEKGLYHLLYSRGFKQREIIKQLGLEQEYKKYKEKTFKKVVDGKIHKRWSWKRVIDTVTPIVEEQGFVPPGQWFNSNGYGSLVQYIYNSNKSWEDLRAHFNSFENSDFVTSRNGMRWRSRPEASLSNFLYARGIIHKTGEKYPEEYSKFGNSSYGYYDIHFKNSVNEWVDVEIWGDKPKGHNESGYAAKRIAKEIFNKTNPLFLGLNYSDCYDDDRLEVLLEKHIGIIEPYIFDKPEDKLIQTTHWSDADELIEYCKEIAKSQPDGIFPTEEWLRKRGKWKDRKGPLYNTVSVYIKEWIGGIRKLRKILGQGENSTISWSRESAIKEYKAWFNKYGFTTHQARTRARNLSNEERRAAQNISSAVAKYVGTAEEVNSLLGIAPKKLTKWSQDIILREAERIYEKYELTPNQIASLSQDDKNIFQVIDEDIAISKQIVDRITTYFSGAKEVYKRLNIQPVDKRILRKQHITVEPAVAP